jgi:catechol 2,3-dioxygenase-like lactoylglutathione lyase family enzyme
MDRSLRFYRDTLGMKVLMDLRIDDDRQARVIGLPGATCRIVHLKLGTGILELFHYATPEGRNVAYATRQCDHGLLHFGFEVNDFHRHVEELQAQGVRLLGEPVEFRPDVWVAYFQGPDGEVFELRQRPESEFTLPSP